MTLTTQKAKIKEINNKLVQMASLIEKQLYESVTALKNHDCNAANIIAQNDDKVDNFQKQIEEDCIKFIATEQPLATDLRYVFTATKIVTDLERIADYAVDICKINNRIYGKGKNPDIVEGSILWDMESKARKMISLGIDAFINIDSEKAYEVCKMDDEIDALYKNLFKNILKKAKIEEEKIDISAQFLFVGKYLERVADHITNICEWTIFAKTGNYVDLNE
ncbi:MAG: phosphate signaling complex protein PhoU [Clostridiales bacterium]|nr:phosphate signaling complex protein PhoU [Clostridiales bacterium]